MINKISLFVLVLLAGFGSLLWYLFYNETGVNTEEQASIVLQKIEEVEKLMLVEGTFAEIYTYQQDEKIFFDLWPIEKKVIVLIKAKANVGYDLSKVEFEIDKELQQVIIPKLAKEIILIESDIQYYDIEQSQFYPLTGKDLTTINQRATELIKQQVLISQLPTIAQERLPIVLGNMFFDDHTQNWKVITQ
ncbi:MAG: hypothetical protein ACI9O4_001401 [Chitinophagales bacterium]|jgi:hypothetical protein